MAVNETYDPKKKWARLGMEWALYAFVIFYPYTVNLANATLIALSFFSLLSSSIGYKIGTFRSTPALWTLPLYFLLVLVGITYSEDVKYGFVNLDRMLPFILLPVFFATGAFDHRRAMRNTAIVFVYNTVVASLYSIVKNVFYLKENGIAYRHLFSWEYGYKHLSMYINLHPTYFSIIILISITLICSVFPWRKAWQIATNILVIVVLLVFLVMLGSKIGLVILFVLGNVAFIVYIVRKKKKALIVGYIAINLLLITIGFNTHIVFWRFRMAYETAINTINGKELSDYRIMHWRCATAAIAEKPLFGYGTGDSYKPLDACYQAMQMDELIGYNCHNQMMESWLKLGIPGLLTILLCMIIPFYISVRKQDYLFGVIFCIYLFSALTESLFSVQKGITLFAMITSVYAGYFWREHNAQ
jgi:O-antigen ligase